MAMHEFAIGRDLAEYLVDVCESAYREGRLDLGSHVGTGADFASELRQAFEMAPQPKMTFGGLSRSRCRREFDRTG